MISTIKIEFSQASIIRCVARQDMPAYGLKEGQVFYCAKSTSLGNNMYHILTWDYANTRWNCPCEYGRVFGHTVACNHTNGASLDCKKQHTLQGYKPLSKAEKFAALRVKYDVRYQAPAVEKVLAQAEQVAREADEKYRVSPELRKAGAFSILR